MQLVNITQPPTHTPSYKVRIFNRRKIPSSKVLNRLSQRVSERSAFVFPILWVVAVGYVYPTTRVCVCILHSAT